MSLAGSLRSGTGNRGEPGAGTARERVFVVTDFDDQILEPGIERLVERLLAIGEARRHPTTRLEMIPAAHQGVVPDVLMLLNPLSIRRRPCCQTIPHPDEDQSGLALIAHLGEAFRDVSAALLEDAQIRAEKPLLSSGRAQVLREGIARDRAGGCENDFHGQLGVDPRLREIGHAPTYDDFSPLERREYDNGADAEDDQPRNAATTHGLIVSRSFDLGLAAPWPTMTDRGGRDRFR